MCDHDRLGTGTEFGRNGKVSCYQFCTRWGKVHGHPSENHTVINQISISPLSLSVVFLNRLSTSLNGEM
jgi:hypothetical protein